MTAVDGMGTAESPRGGALCICGKLSYESKVDAHRDVRAHRDDGPVCKKCARGGRIHAYLCAAVRQTWHVGHTFWKNGNGRTGRTGRARSGSRRVLTGRRRRS